MTLIGATTENPYFEVNSALLSRSQIYELRALEPARRARRCSSGRWPTPSGGSAARPRSPTRRWSCWPSAPAATRGPRSARSSARSRPPAPAAAPIDLEAAEDALQRKAVTFDKQGDRHYDYASALIKSMRGSDPDAAVYWLAAMLEGGEDPRFIARRMVILASEDVGNADPQALLVATAAGAGRRPRRAAGVRAQPRAGGDVPGAGAEVQRLDEGDRRRDADVREHGAKLPPDYLRDAHYPGAKALGHGEGYKYAHDEPGGISDQPLLPPEVQGERFYEPTDRGYEAELRERLEEARRRRGDA